MSGRSRPHHGPHNSLAPRDPRISTSLYQFGVCFFGFGPVCPVRQRVARNVDFGYVIESLDVAHALNLTMMCISLIFHVPSHHLGLRSTTITLSPRRNILLMKRSRLMGMAFFLPLPVFGTSVHISLTFSSTMLQ